MTPARCLSIALLAGGLFVASCGDSSIIDLATPAASTTSPPPGTSVSTAATPTMASSAMAPGSTAAPAAGAPYDPTLVRSDVSCTERGLQGDGDEAYVTAHYVVDGVLGAVCFGEENATVMTLWGLLWTITPPDELQPLTILAAFDDPDGETLAFVTTNGDFDGSAFLMSWNLAGTDPAAPEFALTAAHEFSHILVGHVEQLDRFAEIGTCDGYDNGEGCFLPGSYLDDWVERFWSETELAGLGDEAVDEAGADGRCNLNPGFLGVYAATNPDEDFAESFAAFVFQVDVNIPQLQDKLAFFEERPELVAFRDRAEAAGLDGLRYEFDVCG